MKEHVWRPPRPVGASVCVRAPHQEIPASFAFRSMLATAITKLAEKLGIEGMSSHSFRPSAPAAAHQAGLNLREVAEISGHRSLAALERYLDQDAAREKAEAARSLLVR